MASIESRNRVAFGLFEVDLQSGELWKSGFKVRLQGQPFKVLNALLEKPGEVVTHEELQNRVWGPDTTVDFERALAGAINKIREALGDSAENPRFVETLARRGYRFIAPVTAPVRTASSVVGGSVAQDESAATGQTVTAVERFSPDNFLPTLELNPGTGTKFRAAPNRTDIAREKPHAWSRREIVISGLAFILLLGFLTVLWQARTRPSMPPIRIDQLTQNSPISPGPPNMETLLTMATDGNRILTSALVDGRPQLSTISIGTGELQQLPLPSELKSASLADLSRDGTKLLLLNRLSSESEQPLWVVPTAGGSALRVGSILAHDATWMPDGASILYAHGNNLAVVQLDNGISTPYATLLGRAFWLRWSPDGKRLRFTLMNPLIHTSSIWELDSGSRVPRPVSETRIGHLSECCGTWTADGNSYVFQAGNDRTSNLWELKGGGSHPTLIQLTNGPLKYSSPVAARSGHRIFFVGSDPPPEMQQFVPDRQAFRPVRSFLANANRVAYSRDGDWVAWTDPDGRLWRARADGSDEIQLTPNYLEIFSATWSPNGSKLALMAREPGKAWHIYLIDADGGTPERLLSEPRNEADPSWSADGQNLVFGREPDLMGKDSGPHTIEVLNLKSRKVITLPGSEGLFSPRWSPNGKWIAALSMDQKSVMLFDVASRKWKVLASTSAADPVWSADSTAIYTQAFMADMQPILKISVPEGKIQTIANLANFHTGEIANYFFGGLTPGDAPLVRPQVGTGNLYTLDLDRQ